MPVRSPHSGLSKAEALCRRFPDAGNMTLAKKLYKENVESFANLESARAAVRKMRGCMGKQSVLVRVPKAKGVAGQKPACPPSNAETWEPIQIDGPATVLSLSDLHIPYHDQSAVEAAVKHAKKHKPTVLLLNGDYGDFYRCSKWQQNPKERSFNQEAETMKEGLAWLASQFPKARRIYKLGNHDERWDLFIWQKAPEIWDLPNVQLHNILDFEKHGFERVDDQPIMAGMLPILHGHELQKGIASPVNVARGVFLRTNSTALVGHSHRASSHPESDMWHKQTVCWSQGCLCDMRPKYARYNKWQQGFAVIDVEAGNNFNVHNYQIIDGEVRRA